MPALTAENKIVRVVVIEDQRELREGLRILLDFTPDFQCVHSFGSMEDALENIEAGAADLILTDIGLPRMNGIEGARILRERFPRSADYRFDRSRRRRQNFSSTVRRCERLSFEKHSADTHYRSDPRSFRRRRTNVAGCCPPRRAFISQVRAACRSGIPSDRAGTPYFEAAR